MPNHLSKTLPKTKFVKIILVIFIIFTPLLVKALEIQYPTLPGGISLPKNPQLNEFVRYLYAFFIFISGFIAFGVLIFGGVLYLISGTNIGKKVNAREWMAAGFWGVLILLISYILLATINPQLVGIKKVSFKPRAVPTYNPTPRTPIPDLKEDIGFQIPLGKIIEEAILTNNEPFSIKGKKFNSDKEFNQEIKTTIQGIINDTNQLKPKLDELKALINGCTCGVSICSGDCLGTGCNLNCDLAAIQRKKDEIRNSPLLNSLKNKEQKLCRYITELERRNSNLQKAIYLYTLFSDELRDYFSFVIDRETIEAGGGKVKIETLPEWKEIKPELQTPDGKIIPDPATFYFWKIYKEMEEAINYARTISTSISACPG